MPQASDLRVGVLTPRTAVVLLAGADIRHRLAEPRAWALSHPDGKTTGTAETVAVFLDDLQPDTVYDFTSGGAEIRFRTPICAGLIDVSDFGIDETADDNSGAFTRALDTVSQGGTIYVPPGTWRSSPLFLRSDITLHLAEGARLLGVPDRGAYPILPARDDTGQMLGTWEGLPAPCFASLITAIGCSRLAITGRGRIDGGADAADWWHDHKVMRGAWRPRTVYALRCTDLSLSGVTICNSPSWTVHPVQCTGLRVSGVTITNPSDSPNTDGLNPEMCRNVIIEGSHFSVGDDCIAIKAGKRADDGSGDHLRPTERVLVRNCRMERGHGAVVIGSEMSGSVRNVRVENCEFDRTDRGLRIKTRRGRGGQVAGIAIVNCTMDRVDTAFSANAHYFCDHDGHSAAVQSRLPAPVSELTPHVGGIEVATVRITNARLAVGAFLGLPEAPIGGVSIRDVAFDFDPDAEIEVPLMADDVPPMRHKDLWMENAEVVWSGHTNGAAPAAPAPLDDLLAYFDAYAAAYQPYKRGSWCYEDGLLYLGLSALHRATGDNRWFGHLRRLADAQIAPDGTLDGYDISEYNIDNVLSGRALFHLLDEVGDLRYRAAADLLATQLRNHPRTSDGNYWHKLRYPWQVWLDGLYMGLPFQVEYGQRTGQPALVDDALQQFRSALGLMHKRTTGLHAHAYDETRLQPWADRTSGHNPDHWARANGWLAMALVDTYELVGGGHAGSTMLAQEVTAMLGRIVELQTTSGLWLQVPDQPTLAGNYEEMSASAMFAYALLKADRLGVAPTSGARSGRAAFEALNAVVAAGGKMAEGAGFGPMCQVAGLGPFGNIYRDGSAAYYVSETKCDDDPKGVGPMMMAAAEILRLHAAGATPIR